MGLSKDERAGLIELYRTGYDEVMAALEGITAAEWEAREAEGEWCPREVVHHLGDSEINAASRIRMLVAEARPVITGYDQRRWVDVLYSRERAIEPSLAAFKAAREATLPLLELMTDKQWASHGQHSEAGEIGAETWLEWYGPHAHDHADQIRRARRSSRES